MVILEDLMVCIRYLNGSRDIEFHKSIHSQFKIKNASMLESHGLSKIICDKFLSAQQHYPDLLINMYKKLKEDVCQVNINVENLDQYHLCLEFIQANHKNNLVKRRFLNIVKAFIIINHQLPISLESIQDYHDLSVRIISWLRIYREENYYDECQLLSTLKWYEHQVFFNQKNKSCIFLPNSPSASKLISESIFPWLFYTRASLYRLYSNEQDFVLLHLNQSRLVNQSLSVQDAFACYQNQINTINYLIARLMRIKRWIILPYLYQSYVKLIDASIDFFSKKRKYTDNLLQQQINQWLGSIKSLRYLSRADVLSWLEINESNLAIKEKNKIRKILFDYFGYQLIEYYFNPTSHIRHHVNDTIAFIHANQTRFKFIFEHHKPLEQWLGAAYESYDNLNFPNDASCMLDRILYLLPETACAYFKLKSTQLNTSEKEKLVQRLNKQFKRMNGINVDDSFGYHCLIDRDEKNQIIEYISLSPTYYQKFLKWINSKDALVKVTQANDLSFDQCEKFFVKKGDHYDWLIRWAKSIACYHNLSNKAMDWIMKVSCQQRKSTLAYHFCHGLPKKVIDNTISQSDFSLFDLSIELESHRMILTEKLFQTCMMIKCANSDKIKMIESFIQSLEKYKCNTNLVTKIKQWLVLQRKVLAFKSQSDCFVQSLPSQLESMRLSDIISQYQKIISDMSQVDIRDAHAFTKEFSRLINDAVLKWIAVHQSKSDFCYGVSCMHEYLKPLLINQFGAQFSLVKAINTIYKNKAGWLVKTYTLTENSSSPDDMECYRLMRQHGFLHPVCTQVSHVRLFSGLRSMEDAQCPLNTV